MIFILSVSGLLKLEPFSYVETGLFCCWQKTGVVDGNVIRVLARARAIGADSTSAVVQSTIW